MTEIKGPKPLFGEGLYNVTCSDGDGYLWYDETDDAWYNVEINDQPQEISGKVLLINYKVLDNQILSTETVDVH